MVAVKVPGGHVDNLCHGFGRRKKTLDIRWRKIIQSGERREEASKTKPDLNR